MLQTTDEGGVRLLRLDRPEKLNAMSQALYHACADDLAEAATNDGIGAVVITGNGRAFCAGNDMGDLRAAAAGETGSGAANGFGAFMDAITTFPKVLVAAVNGVGIGIGMTMLAYCDVALIAESARLRGPFVPLGVAPEAGSSATFPAIMGWQRVSRLLLTGGWIAADEAVACGLALEVVPDDEVVERAVAIAREAVTAGPLESLMATKRLIIDARRDLVDAARSREDATFVALFEAGTPGRPPAF